MKKTPFFAVFVLCLTAACGGGSAGGNAAVTFASLDVAADDLISAYVADTGLPVVGLTRTDDLGSVGGVGTYEGAFRGAVEGDRVVGDITLNVDIGNGTVVGDGTNFQHEVDGAYTGSLSGAGSIASTTSANIPQVLLVLRGTLTAGNVAQPTAIALDGDFYANGADDVGAIAGPAEGNFGSAFITDGVFAVEK